VKPRILVATDFPPDAPGGGPSVVRQMLAGFPGDVHWWSCQPAISAETIHQAGFKIASHQCNAPGRLRPARLLTRSKAFLMQRLWAPRAAASLGETIRRTDPSCVWAIPHDWSIFPLHRVLVDERGRRAIPRLHVTVQDYPDVHGHAETWGAARTARLARLQEEIYVLATSRDATSWPMLDDLRRRTGAAGSQMLHQGLELEDFEFLGRTPPDRPAAAPVRIAYAGTVLAHDAFACFVRMLEAVRRRGLDVRMEFWGAHSNSGRPWFRSYWMAEHGHLPEAGLLASLRACDWGFAPMALSDDDPRYNRFSFPTKFITYLAAGLPVVTMGHPESSVMRAADEYPVGLSLKPGSYSAIAQLHESLADLAAKSAYRPGVVSCARKLFDGVRMRTQLWNMLLRASA